MQSKRLYSKHLRPRCKLPIVGEINRTNTQGKINRNHKHYKSNLITDPEKALSAFINLILSLLYNKTTFFFNKPI